MLSVNPMHVFNDHQYRTLLGEGDNLVDKCFKCFLPPLLWRQLDFGIASIIWQ